MKQFNIHQETICSGFSFHKKKKENSIIYTLISKIFICLFNIHGKIVYTCIDIYYFKICRKNPTTLSSYKKIRVTLKPTIKTVTALSVWENLLISSV